MALSFLYLAFLRVLQLLKLSRRDNTELAIEVVMLRHEVAVLRREVARPALRPPDRALLAGLSLWVPKMSSVAVYLAFLSKPAEATRLLTQRS